MTTHIVRSRGFTIVELLIVIVIIGILAASTIVAYIGSQSRARETICSRYCVGASIYVYEGAGCHGGECRLVVDRYLWNDSVFHLS